MHFEIVIPARASASSSRLQTPKPQPPPAATGAARPATIIAKRPRGRPPRKVTSNQDKLNAIARHLHAEYKWSLKDVIRHMVVDEPGNGGDTSITTTTQQQQEARVGALIEAIWGQPEVLSELEAHPKFPASRGKKLDNNDTEDRDGNGSAEEADENEERDEMSVDSGREATIEDENEGDMSVEASAEVQNKGKMSVEASADDENGGEISVDASAKDDNVGGISMEASVEDEFEREEISGSTQEVASAEEENPPTSGQSYSTPEEEEVPTISFPFLFPFVSPPPRYHTFIQIYTNIPCPL